MRVFKSYNLILLALLIIAGSLVSCVKTVEQELIYDNIIFEIDTTSIYSSGAEKTKLKSTNQFISTLYSDLYRQPISSAKLLELSILRLSIGDKMLVNEMIMTNFLQDTQVQQFIASEEEMRDDPTAFVEQTFLRFFLRKPNAYELLYFTNLIEEDEDMYPELIYRSFILSDEYMFY